MGVIRVLVVEDDPMVRNALEMLLDAADGYELAGLARHGGEALPLFRETRPDVVLLDIQMPVKDGIAATRELLQEDPGARILTLTAFSSQEFVIPALRAGTAGYLLKDARPREILDAIEAVHRGEAVLSPAVTRELIATVKSEDEHPGGIATSSSPGAAESSPPPADPGLTPRELDVLRCLAEGNSNREIADTLFVSEATVKATLGRIAQKFQVRDRVQVLIHAVRLGIVDVGHT
ncbi:response regulator transcription factor [Miniimonas sp. S16]|uniref:response regulator n=1 Tax=Miniimonas sp. S16 TaxID=2171623 RepID=UPI001F2155FA|nr:response regulator transcription factor [Miniimonas sp. S16]